MAEQSSNSSFYQKLAAFPLMTPERRQGLLERFYTTQLEIIGELALYMVPLYRYFAQELEQRNTDSDPEEGQEATPSARVSRLKGSQLKQIAKMLMELREAKERNDEPAITIYIEQFKELMLGFDYALISTLASEKYILPEQLFLQDAATTDNVIGRLKELALKADEDRNALFTGNWRLVMEIARRFQAFGSKLDLDEMIQEGNTGLLAAIDKFNPKMNNQLSTLAANWIQAKIRRALDNKSETIRTPVYKRQRKKLVQRAEMELLLEAQSNSEPTAEDLKKPQGLKTGAEKLFGRTIEDKAIADKTGLSIDEVRELRRLYPETVSIHATLDGSDDNESQERGDLIADKAHEEEPVHDKADRQLFFKILGGLVDDLPLTHQVVLSGLNGLPMRKAVLIKLVQERAALLVRRGKAVKDSVVLGKAAVQVFK